MISRERIRQLNRECYNRHRAARKAQNRTARHNRRKWFHELKATKKCANCPETHPYCLEFHHLNPKDKVDHVGGMANSTWSKKKILAEIAKCQVLCANCHRKQTYKEMYEEFYSGNSDFVE